MPDTDIERTIFRLELDGSAYIAGADKLSDSTSKLAAAQEKANAKLAELQKTHAAYKKSLDEINNVLKANEKETLELTKQLNSLKDSEKGTTAEATRLKTALRDISVNTKEFKAEAKELSNNLVSTTTQIKIQTKEIEAGAKANGNFAAGLTKAYSGLRTLANIIPGIGIGGLVALIAGPVVEAFGDWFNSITKTTDSLKILQKATEESFKGGESGFVKASENVNELRLNVELAKQGFIDKQKVVEEYNTTMGKTAGTVKTLDEVEQKLVEHGDAYIQMMLLKAAANFALGKAAEKAFEAEEKRRKEAEEFLTAGDKFIRFGAGNVSAPGFVPGAQEQATKTQIAFNKEQSEKRKAAAVKQSQDESNTFESIAKKFQEDAARIAKEHKFNFFSDTKDTKDKAVKGRTEITNIYEQELQKLKSDIAKLDEKGFTDEATITKAVEEDFKKRSDAFEKAQKKGQLTPAQLTSLNKNLTDLQTLTLSQNLKSFREQKATYLAQIQNELDALQIEENSKRIASIQERFERERALIISEIEKTVNAIKQKRDKQISDITKNAAKNGLSEADLLPQITAIKNTYSKLLDDIGIIKNQKLQQLSFDTFEKLSEDAKRLLDSGNLGISQGSLLNIKAQTQFLQQGKISFKQYQKELTDIAGFEASERFRIDKLFLDAEIKVRQDKLASDKSLTSEQIKRLEDEIRALQQKLTDADKANQIAGTKGSGSNEFDAKVDSFVKYTQAIGGLAESVISFWAQANEAEQAALDRSIALQEKRVDAAQRIADRGNAQYLKQEEDRLTQLNVQKENAARKQLGINAALQTSEILVALISGLAQGAKIGGGLGAIASVAAIVAAIAGAFAIAQSLKPPTPTFFTGTKDTGRGGRGDSKGGFTATLHPNEAVIPSKQNKAYHPTVAAVYDGTVPAEHLNNFVKNYHRIKTVPQPDYSRIKEAAEMHIGNDGRMHVAITEQNKLIVENNDLQRQTLRAMKSMAVSATIDKNGVAIAVNEYIEQMNIDKRV